MGTLLKEGRFLHKYNEGGQFLFIRLPSFQSVLIRGVPAVLFMLGPTVCLNTKHALKLFQISVCTPCVYLEVTRARVQLQRWADALQRTPGTGENDTITLQELIIALLTTFHSLCSKRTCPVLELYAYVAVPEDHFSGEDTSISFYSKFI